MKLIQIVFTEWRDAGAVSTELQAAALAVARASTREASVRKELSATDELLAIADTQDLKVQRAGAAQALISAVQASRAALDAQDDAASAAERAMKQHSMVGKTGYQVLSDAGDEVTQVVDQDGNALPEGAVYGYSVANTNPPLPAWAMQAKGVSA